MDDWQDIVDQNKQSVWTTAYRLVGHREDAEDCVQETFVAALQLASREPIENWAALLARLCTCRALDRLRSRSRRDDRVQCLPDWSAFASRDSGPDERVEAAELSARLRASLALLPARQAEVVCFHCLNGVDICDIAKQLDTTTDAVRQTSRSRRRQKSSNSHEEGL